jgi:hypothetical protein
MPLPWFTRTPEPEAARQLIDTGHPYLGFSLSLTWLLSRMLVPAVVAIVVVLIRG